MGWADTSGTVSSTRFPVSSERAAAVRENGHRLRSSGRRYRPVSIERISFKGPARTTMARCTAMKAALKKSKAGRVLDGRTWDEMPKMIRGAGQTAGVREDRRVHLPVGV